MVLTHKKACICVLWDGKKTETLEKSATTAGGSRNESKKKEHLVVVDLEHRCFIGEFIPSSGSGRAEAEGVKLMLIKKGIPIQGIKLICGDSTNANCGFKDGSFAWMEELCEKAFHWNVCLCHLVELPLRKLVQTLCGETSGPGTFKGGLGLKLQNVNTVPAG